VSCNVGGLVMFLQNCLSYLYKAPILRHLEVGLFSGLCSVTRFHETRMKIPAENRSKE